MSKAQKGARDYFLSVPRSIVDYVLDESPTAFIVSKRYNVMVTPDAKIAFLSSNMSEIPETSKFPSEFFSNSKHWLPLFGIGEVFVSKPFNENFLITPENMTVLVCTLGQIVGRVGGLSWIGENSLKEIIVQMGPWHVIINTKIQSSIPVGYFIMDRYDVESVKIGDICYDEDMIIALGS